MGIYITGMEMPKEQITAVINPNGLVEILSLDNVLLDEFYAVPVPPHGDLIDRYDLKNKEITIDYDEWDDCFDDGLLFVADLIDNAPTIIPAEEGKA